MLFAVAGIATFIFSLILQSGGSPSAFPISSTCTAMSSRSTPRRFGRSPSTSASCCEQSYEGGLARAIGEAHRRYTCHVNEREGWRGYLWQGRFGSFVMDEDYFLRAMRYVELNPVRAGLAASPADWPWSSARAHLTGNPDPPIGDVREMVGYIGDWERYLALDVGEAELLRLRKHARTGRPPGNEAFIRRLEEVLGRFLRKRKPGPKGPRGDN